MEKKLQMNFLSEYFLGSWENRNTSIFNMTEWFATVGQRTQGAEGWITA